MGKKLIIKGADFSANAITVETITDITSLFNFTNGGAYQATKSQNSTTIYQIGDIVPSQLWRNSVVDISEYAGKTLRITSCRFTTSAGQRSGYGNVFKDANNSVPLQDGYIDGMKYPVDGWGDYFPVDGDATSRSTTIVEKVLTIPNDAKYLCVSYPTETQLNTEVKNSMPFKAEIIYEEQV